MYEPNTAVEFRGLYTCKKISSRRKKEDSVPTKYISKNFSVDVYLEGGLADFRHSLPVWLSADAALSEIHDVLGQGPGLVAEDVRDLYTIKKTGDIP